MIYQNKWRIILHHLGEGITEFLEIFFSKEWIPIIFTIVRIKSLGKKKKLKILGKVIKNEITPKYSAF